MPEKVRIPLTSGSVFAENFSAGTDHVIIVKILNIRYPIFSKGGIFFRPEIGARFAESLFQGNDRRELA